MHVIWFKRAGEWEWVEVYLKTTADAVRNALRAQGYDVTETSFDPRKYSIIEGK